MCEEFFVKFNFNTVADNLIDAELFSLHTKHSTVRLFGSSRYSGYKIVLAINIPERISVPDKLQSM